MGERRGGEVLEEEPHEVRWSIACMDKKKRVFDIRHLSVHNKAFLGKWF